MNEFSYYEQINMNYVLLMAVEMGGCSLGEDERGFYSRTVNLVKAAPSEFFKMISKRVENKAEYGSEEWDKINALNRASTYWPEVKKVIPDGLELTMENLDKLRSVLHGLLVFLNDWKVIV